MATQSNRNRLNALRVLHILQNNTDVNNLLDKAEIKKIYKKEFKVDPSDKLIDGALEALLSVEDYKFGFKIKTNKDLNNSERNYYYYCESTLSPQDLSVLIDTIYLSKHLPKEAKKKLTNNININHYYSDKIKLSQAKTIEKNSIQEISISENKYKNYLEIKQAIERNEKIEFKYLKPSNTNSVELYRYNNEDEIFEASCYYFLVENDRLVVVSNLGNNNNLTKLFVDRIFDVKRIIKSKAVKYEYISENQYEVNNSYGVEQHNPEIIEYAFETNKDYSNETLFSELGKILITETINGKEVSGKEEKAYLKSWILKNGNSVTLTKPDSLIQEIKEEYQILLTKYNNPIVPSEYKMEAFKKYDSVIDWIKQWFILCDQLKIKPWEFDFKDIGYQITNQTTKSYLNNYKQYLINRNIDLEQQDVFSSINLKHPFIYWLYYKEVSNFLFDPDTIAYPIYSFLGWMDENATDNNINVLTRPFRADNLNSMKTTITRLIIDSKNKEIIFKKADIDLKSRIQYEKLLALDIDGTMYAEKIDTFKSNLDQLNIASSLTHSIGNFIYYNSKFNIDRNRMFHDYWDRSLNYIKEQFTKAYQDDYFRHWKAFIDKYFLNAYVNQDYEVIELFPKSLENNDYPKGQDIGIYFSNSNENTLTRGKDIIKAVCIKLLNEVDLEFKRQLQEFTFYKELNIKK